MNVLLESLTGMNNLSDQVISTDFLLASKSAVRNYAIAITETTSPKLRATLKKHLKEAIHIHEIITNYMTKKQYYNSLDLGEQYNIDMKVTETALNLVGEK